MMWLNIAVDISQHSIHIFLPTGANVNDTTPLMLALHFGHKDILGYFVQMVRGVSCVGLACSSVFLRK